MIINIRGTSGSGKTHLVRQVMDRYDGRYKFYEKGRRQPIGYLYHLADTEPEHHSLAIIGHYETACGGCDTISKMEKIFELVQQSAEAGHDVLFEGLLIAADVNRHVATWEWARERDIPMEVMALTTPLDVCIDSVNARRHARNPDLPPVKTRNTEAKFGGVLKSMERLQAAGVPTWSGTREEALAHIEDLLKI